ncbi:MAG: xanthine dehydrogenase YagR molybdenum-binding subunit [Acidobacteriota bacterium]|jgi:xanthine dehydrogenase YagR molybdenum-binding subunit|nr:xanthine dehydrogenase YagR molybdenum-binding subunit [Acidobacteriota bacterium]
MQQQPVKKKKKIRVPKVINGVETMVEVEVDDDGGPGWGPNDKHTLLNHRLTRVDAPLKVSGAARYTYDVRLPGMLYGRVLRSPHAHARVLKVDASAARRLPGVRAIVGATDEEVTKGSNRVTEVTDRKDQTDKGQTPPADKREHIVRFAGEPVAAVAADTPELAEDAIRAIKVEYEVLPNVVRAEDALKEGAPRVYPDGNLTPKEKRGDEAKVDEALAKADVRLEAEYRTPIVHHACLETHGNTVDYRGGETATVYASTQWTFSIPDDAAHELGLSKSAVTSIVEHMGGGFGSKFGIGIEGMFACQLSKQAKAPVKLLLTRKDEFLLAGNRSGSWQKFKAGANKDGTLVALRALQYQLGGLGDGSQAGQPYIYNAANFYRERIAIHTNEDSSRAMRAPGHPQASFGIESLMDELAYKLGMDPVEFRKKNLKDLAYHRQLDRGAREIGWERRNKMPGGGSGPLKRGMGCGVGTWGGGGNDQCKVDVTIARDGSVIVAVGTQDLGTGTRTYTRAIVAEELGLQLKDIIEKIGNSTLGSSNPSGGSTTAASLAPSVKDAAVKARLAVAEKIAPLLGGIKPEEINFTDGKVSGGGKSLTWKQACAALPSAGIAAHGAWRSDLAGHGVHGACFAEVEVDVETGHVRPIKMVQVQDVGLPLNRLAIESQINGGMLQSLGMALWEGRVMDAQLGLQLNPGFGDYKLPGSLEIPELVPLIDDEDKREAVIGVGEASIIPALGAVVNAVHNACGVRVRELPITPDKILMGLMNERRNA